MLNQSAALDRMFQALADFTRRAMVERLSRGPASVSELAKPLAISLPAVVQHLQVLEASGLIRSEKVGRVRTCQIEPKALQLLQYLKDHPLHAKRKAITSPVQSPMSISSPTQSPQYGDTGFHLTSGTSYGVHGGFSAIGGISITKPSINNDIVIYAPTTEAYASCLEVVTSHWSPAGTSATYHGPGFWDWCALGAGGDGTGGWQEGTWMSIDPNWGAKYLIQGSGISLAHFGFYVTDKSFQVRTYKTTNNPPTGYNCWKAEIWNASTGSYDLAATSCGTPALQDG